MGILIAVTQILIQYHNGLEPERIFQDVEPERVFSGFVTKIGSSLNDKSVEIKKRMSIKVPSFVPNFIYYYFHLNLINGIKSV
jgi:hypothetical protein